MIYDLIIVGGGPAGAAAAITAARSGARVVLLERGHFPRHKVCGEFVSGESLALLSSLIAGECQSLLTESIRISRSRVFIDERVLPIPISPPAASIARYDLDLTLWRSAAQSGVDARQPVTVKAIEGRGPFQLDTSDGRLNAQAVINASGRWSNLTQRSTTRAQSQKWLGLKGHFAESAPAASVDLYFFEGGYCGVSPVDLWAGKRGERVNACAMASAKAASSLSEVFALNPALQARARDWRPLSEPVTTSPLIFCHPEPECNGVLMAGDAAAFVDPFVGDGISLALRSGALAADCLIPFFRREISYEGAVKNYRQSYRDELGSIFRTSAQIRRLVGLPRAIRVPLVAILQKTPVVTRYMVSRTR